MSVKYEYFGPHGERRSVEMDDREGAQSIGERVAVGFPCVHRRAESPDGSPVTVVYFQSDVTGAVWAVYCF